MAGRALVTCPTRKIGMPSRLATCSSAVAHSLTCAGTRQRSRSSLRLLSCSKRRPDICLHAMLLHGSVSDKTVMTLPCVDLP